MPFAVASLPFAIARQMAMTRWQMAMNAIASFFDGDGKESFE